MSDDDLERLLADSFDRQARASVGEGASPPRARFLDPPAPRRHRAARWAAPFAAAAAVVGVVIGVVVVQDRTPTTSGTAAHQPGPLGSSAPSSPPASPSASTGARTAVHVSLNMADDTTVGVGMPVIAYFSKPITDARALESSTTLTVNGKPALGAWYFERSAARRGYPIEGHFRMSSYWPANSKIRLTLPIKGLPAGGEYAYDDSLTLDFVTGPAQIVTVDDAEHTLVLTRDGKPIETAPVSLGAASTPTTRGVKVIMEKGKNICMSGPGYHECGVKWTQRLTYGGEYLHAAPWNAYNIAHGIDSSNGCTNLSDADAKRLFGYLKIGDVVDYPNADGPPMTLGAGYGDWNVSWETWLTGGAVPTR